MRRGRVLGIVAALGALSAFVTPAARATSVPGAAACPLFPADSWWHSDISARPAHPQSDTFVASMGADGHVHADFGSGTWDGGPIGIPYVVVSGSQPAVAVTFDYADESDPGPYRVPPDAPIEGGSASGGDRHVLVVDRDNCQLAELYAAYPNADGSWHAGSAATWDLRSNALRPDSWTSADAAGLPILPGLVRYDEVASGHIDHAIRMTARTTARAHIWPARHDAGSSSGVVPMGLRLRLKASFDMSGYPAADRVILDALKTYGAVIADNGSSWYISGAPDPGWDDDVLHLLGQVSAAAFEAVDTSGLELDPASGQYAGGAVPAPPAATDDPAPPPAPPAAEAPAPTATVTSASSAAAPSTTAVSATTAPASPTTSSSTRRAAAAPAASVRRTETGGGNRWWLLLAGLVVAGIGAAGAWARRRATTRS